MKKTIEAIKSMLSKYNNQIFTAGICMYVFAIIFVYKIFVCCYFNIKNCFYRYKNVFYKTKKKRNIINNIGVDNINSIQKQNDITNISINFRDEGY